MLKDEKYLQNEFRNDNFETVVVSTWDGTYVHTMFMVFHVTLYLSLKLMDF